jgi:hypothetical protein
MSQIVDEMLSIMGNIPQDDIKIIDPTWKSSDRYTYKNITISANYMSDQIITYISINDTITIKDEGAVISQLLEFYTAETTRILREWFSKYRANSGVWTLARKTLMEKFCNILYRFIGEQGFIIDPTDFIYNCIQLLRLSESRNTVADIFHIGTKILLYMTKINPINICKLYIAMIKNDMESSNIDSMINIFIDAWISAKLSGSTKYEANILILYIRIVAILRVDKRIIQSRFKSKMDYFDLELSQIQCREINNILSTINIIEVAKHAIFLLHLNDIDSRDIKILLADIYILIANILSENPANLSITKEYNTKAEKIYTEIQDYFGIAQIYISVAALITKYSFDTKYGGAIDNLLIAHKMFSDLHLLSSAANTRRLLAVLYADLYNKFTREANMQLAENYLMWSINNFTRTIKEAIDINKSELVASSYYGLAKLYEIQFNFTKDPELVPKIIMNFQLSYDYYSKNNDVSIRTSISVILFMIAIESANRYNTDKISQQFEMVDRLFSRLSKDSSIVSHNTIAIKNMISDYKIKYSSWINPLTQNKIIFGSGKLFAS